MLQQATEAVKAFMDKMGVPTRRLTRPTFREPLNSQMNAMLKTYAETLRDCATTINNRFCNDETLLLQGDERLRRAHLMMSELAELLFAMADRDEVAALDGIADLIYTAIGTGITFLLPTSEAFTEVHRSNMTKDRKVGYRERWKGPDFSPANLIRVMSTHYLKGDDREMEQSDL